MEEVLGLLLMKRILGFYLNLQSGNAMGFADRNLERSEFTWLRDAAFEIRSFVLFFRQCIFCLFQSYATSSSTSGLHLLNAVSVASHLFSCLPIFRLGNLPTHHELHKYASLTFLVRCFEVLESFLANFYLFCYLVRLLSCPENCSVIYADRMLESCSIQCSKERL